MAIINLLWFISYGSHVLSGFQVSSGLKYEETPKYMGDPEPYNAWTDPPNPFIWPIHDLDSENVGLLFAGDAEFFWIVDLRIDFTEPETWSVGNLITDDKVLTTCRAATMLKNLLDQYELPRATFCRLYVWEYVLEGGDNYYRQADWKYGGTRRVKDFIVHKKCEEQTLTNDVAVLSLESKVQISLPSLGPMPIIVEPENFDIIPEVHLSNMVKEKRLCFVGSIGRDYLNCRAHIVKDFKVRIRVYYENWSTCFAQKNRLCNSSLQNCEAIFNGDKTKQGWMCFRSRARVGTVCDHDRGSPLVCDGEVVGLVLLGAKYDFCNNRLPLPFIVSQINKFQGFLSKFSIEKTPYDVQN